MAEFVRSQVCGTTFEVNSRYMDLQPVGMGTFGMVCSARDQLTGQPVAIKKIIKPLSTPVLSKRTYRELKLLKHLRHENADHQLERCFNFPTRRYLLCDRAMGNRSPPPLDFSNPQESFHPILSLTDPAGVVHRDLKPSNILINENCDLKICDFGLARVQTPDMTGYVSTRYYRAPENMLTWQKYDVAIDIWSAGCIFAEMWDGKPLFPGEDHINQFLIIIDLLGTTPDDLVQTIYSENTLRFVNSLPLRKRQNLANKFRNADTGGMQYSAVILRRTQVDESQPWTCLSEYMLDPKKRIRAGEALAHEYLEPYHDPSDEPVAHGKIDWSLTMSICLWKIGKL
ncbi:mitogen-activated protein kinase hog1 [Penicillium sp. IBT 16267x]|nr:mitogen-activated protein kinase hog1 [Penicillium sp. IBT 16267x]